MWHRLYRAGGPRQARGRLASLDMRRLDCGCLAGLSPRLKQGGAGLAILMTVLTMVGGCSVSRTLRPASYTVQRGDTLYGVARHYHINWRDLAHWNHIRPPYRIHVGEQLALKPYPRLDYAHMSKSQTATKNQSGANPRRPAPTTPGRGRTRPLAAPSAPTVTRTPGKPQKSSRPQTGNDSADKTQPDQRPASAEQPPAAVGEENSIDNATSSAATRQTAVKAGGPSADGWQWPASGSLLQGYDSSKRRRGIEIGGKIGSPIYAASSGTVVYNGSGLKGYGKLIIIKHDEHYLSAYGFIDKSLVKQGQTVAAGAQIADMGRGPGNKPMLHFEIRHDGDPIDPQKVLPDR